MIRVFQLCVVQLLYLKGYVTPGVVIPQSNFPILGAIQCVNLSKVDITTQHYYLK